ncbi:hypothetical protein TURU_097406 [Turdus rufiventris]|nr:hypothetical protein TURU_097406 [Turdus rufiventris]
MAAAASCSSAAAAGPGPGPGSCEWLLLRDGCLRCDADGLCSLCYHPALNAILAVTARGAIKVIDGTSGATLQASALGGGVVGHVMLNLPKIRSSSMLGRTGIVLILIAKPGGRVKCQYISAVDKVIFVDDYAVGCRKDLNGILLLDTALQTPVSKQDDVVQLELPVTEAQQLLSACIEKVDVSSTEGYDLFITQLKDGLKNTSHETAANHKVAKWATVTFHLPHHVLKSVASAIVNELKKINQNIAALPVASSVMDRLSYLLPSARPELGVGPGRSVDRSLMYSEANRRETFTSWPHVGYRWAQPDPMAQAGFYHQVHLKFEINAYDPAIVQQLMLSGEQSSGVDSRRPTLAWLEDSSSCSDIPKLEGDSDDLLEDSDSEEHSRSESVTGHTSQKETMEVSLDITALSVLQQPEKLQWEIVANVLEDTVKDLEELGANPCLANCKSEKMKEKHLEQHNIPFPCLLAGGLLTYKSPATSPVSSNSQRSLDGLSRTRGESVSEQGSTDNESCTNSELNSPLVRRTLPVLLLYSIKESDEKAGKLFSQMNNIMSKSIHDDGFTVPQIIEMELDSQEQLLLQDPPVTYIQQFADAAANLTSPDSDKWSSMVPKPGTLVQCLRLPKFAEEENLCVDSITPCADGVHLLVGLRTCPVESLSAINQVEALNNLNKLNSALCNRRKGELESSLAVVNGTSIDVIQHESPADVPTPLIIQPEQRSVSGGYLVLYKMNYATRIVTLEEEPVKIQHIKDPQDTITSMILLPPDILDNREDDCGELHFLQIGGTCDDIDEADILVDGSLSKSVEQSSEGTKPLSNPSSPGITGVDLLVDQPFSLETLTSLVELTRFETLTPRFSATVPPCWVEVQQEQQQRRHPQHLHQQHHGDAAQHTRTWKLQTDSNSWDEHVFELVLPKACMVGHVDFKFVLNSNITNIPQIQVTLLKNKAPGLGKVNEAAVDRQITFPLSPAHNIEVERNGKPGLVEFSEEMQYMDVEEPQCMAGGKYRSFLIHVKAVNDRGTEEICNGGIRPVVRIPPLKPQTNKGHSLASLLAKVAAGKEKPSSKIEATTSSRKSDNLRGCDLLQEVSVTIRRFKKTSISKERVQRCAMLQFSEFHEKLLTTLCKKTEDGLTTEHAQSLVLDTLCWLAGVYSNGPGSNGRCDPSQQGFGSVLLKALLDNMPLLPAAATGGSVYWYFVLLNYVKDEDLAGCSTACASLLTAVSRQLQDRLTPMEALLQTRYGLYSSPFDPVLFDLEICGSSCKNVYNSSIGVQSDEIDLSDVLSGNGKISSCAAAEGSFTSLTGLLEVEPLHFTCVSTSDGTRIERDDAMSTFGVTPAVGGLSSGTVGEASTALSSAAQVALQSLSHAMASAEQQLQVLQEKQQQLLKLQQQKAKLEAKLHQTTAAAAAAASAVGPVHNSVPSNTVAAPGFFIHPSDVIPPTPKTTPLFMTPPLTPPNEAVSAVINAELAQLFPGSVIDPPTVNLAAHNKNTSKARTNPLGSGLALAISHASHFLQPPPHQSIIIERMHSGARRFVTLDFGRPILLTDVLIPTCGDLASLSIDIWTLGEEVDGRRLVVATDISTHSLILHDLLPPPVCRFMKITVIGRYGSTNARAKIPLGFYYGHTYILPFENELKLMHDPLRGEGEAANQPEIDQHLAMMVALQEDIQCRYNLACHRLEILLQSIDLPPLNSANNAQYFLRKPDKAVEEDSRVFSAYQDCIQLQLQLNLAHHAVQRLKVALGASRKTLKEQSDPKELIQMSSTEQLRTIIRYLLDTLLSLLHSSNGVLDIPMISWVVMLVSRLLDYVATVEDEAATAKKPLNGKERERFLAGNQWSFINNSLHTQSLSRSTKGNSSLDRLYSRKIRKQLVHHKQQLNLLKAKQKALVEQMEKEKIQSNKGSSYKLLVEQAKLKQATSKHFKDLIRLRRTAEWPRSSLDTEVSTAKETPEIEPLPFTLAHERCISVVQKLALFLLSMDFTCHADLLLFVCKVLARIANATRPTIHLCEIVNETQLERLLLLLVGTDFNRGDISWGGAWAQYSLTCMLQDILAGELLAPIAAEAMEESALGEDAGASAGDSDDSLQQSTVQLVETIDEPLTHDITGAPPLSSLEKDKDIDLELLQDLMEVDIDPLDIDLEKDPLAAKVFKPISSTWYDYWGAEYGTYNYNPYIGGVGIPVAKPPVTTEKNGSQTVSISVSQVTQSPSGTDDSLLRGLHAANQNAQLIVQLSSIPMLSACFNKLFSMLQVHHVQLESLLQLWLTLSLNSSSSGSKDNGADIFLYNANRIPVVSLNQAGPSNAIGAQESTAQLLVSDPNLIHVLVKFLSGTNPHGTNQHSPQVGPTATQAMQEFLTRLQVHLSSTCPQMFSEFLLKLIHILSTERGAFQTGQGPLDAQVKLLEFTLEQNFEVVSVSTISAVIESITFLVHHYITCSDKVMSRSGSDSSVGARACFGGLFANIIRPGDAKAVCGEMTRDQLMFDLLKLINILVQLPLSSNREYSARVPVASSTTDSVSDEEKVSGGKDGNGSNPNTQGSTAYVADLVLANQQIMSQILSALGQCNSSAMAMIIGASGLHLTKHENFHGGLDAISVGDGLFTILTTLSKKATTVQVMLQPILTYMACGYMGRQGSLATCQLSEPLLWFILRVLDTSEALKAFHDMGGVQLICNNMVTSTRAIVNTARSMVSTIMKFLDSGPTKATDSSLKARVLASEPDNAEGIHNFAPLGSITSSSPTAQPAEVLLQATPPHRRARSAAWSYIFLPEEAWCDLTIHLPAAVLLKEIHIQPHLASLATCPSSVSVEISADGVNMLPLSTPVITSGLTYIKIQLVKAEVASAVCLRLHRPRDASTLGLSQIKLLGLTAFGNTSSATVNNPFLPSEDQVSKTSIGWLRLLHHCLTHISDLEGMMASAAAPTANLLQTCAALLMSPYCGMHSPNIEAVLVKIGLQSTRIGLKLIDILLRNCSASGSDPADILYQLGTTQDPGTKDRIQALLKWVSDSARVAAMKKSGRVSYICPSSSTREYGLLMPSPSHLHCVAAILWHSYELLVEYDLPALLDRELFESLFNWSMSLPCNMVLKKAVDSLLCSMCHIHPNYFSLLMGWMGITPPPMQCQHRLSMTDDSKKQDLGSSLTDDSKNAQAPLALTESHLATLAASSQSPEAIKQLLDSGLPSLLVRSLASFCFNHTSSSDCTAQSMDITQDRLRRHHVPQHFNKMPITADLVAPVLRFLTEVGNSHMMKDWLGGSEVNPLWTALLFLLCHSGATSGGHNMTAQQTSARSSLLSSTVTTGLTTQQRTAIENATVAFFLQCISCHPNNQRLMAQLYKGRINATSHVIQHPMYGAGHKFRTLHLPVSTTLAEVLDHTPSITAKLINEQKEDKEKKNYEEKEKVKAENGFQDNYSVVVASGLKSQSKRAVSSTPPRPPSRRGRVMADKVGASSSGGESSSKTISVPVFHLYHKLLPGQPLPAEMTLAQLLTLLYDRKLPQGYRSIDLTVKLGSKVISDPSLSKTDSFKRLHTEKEHADLLGPCPEDEAISPGDECMDAVLDESLLETCPIQSPLQVFAGMGGLALIAERLPMLYPDVIQQVSTPVVTSATQEKQKDSDQFEWVTIEQSGELVYEAPETIAAEPPPIKSTVQTMSPIPAHSLAAFGLFLRLPGYAEVLLKERKHAQCLLRLVLGVTDDGEGSHILQSPSANVLPTLPFHVLRSLFSTTPLTTDDGVLLRRMALEIGAIHLILACLSALSHHAPRVPNSSPSQAEPQVSSTHNTASTEEQQLYWAKGTGFGTGSTASGWDVEQALTKQRLEEEHVTCLLQVLASYINPAGSTSNEETQTSHEGRGQNSSALPSVLLELLSQSCLIPAMSSYLRNDSVLDMARHVPLYRALLELLRAIASCTSMVPLLLPLSGESNEEEEEQLESQASVGTLLAKMKTCVDTYTNRLRSKKDKAKAGVKPDSSDQEPEGLTLLVPDIQKTAEIVYAATTSLRQANQEKKMAEYSKKAAVKPKPLSVLRSLEEKYVAVMKKLQFDTFEMVSEDDDGKLVFKVNYHYMSQVKNASDANSAARARRLAQEAVTLSTSLPLSSSSSVFVRCDEERLDIMKVLITGPADTPYANGCFEFDVYFPQDYPNSPPLVNLETTGGHSVRFNPNLYNDGKVLVSVQSLILVAEPYFNEPGYERSRGTPSGTQSSREYDGNIRQATVKWAMLEQMRNPSPCFKEVIHKHFYLKRVEIMAQCEEWIADIQQYSSDKRVGRTMSHHAAALKRHTAQLREELLKLPCPEGLDPDTDDSPEKCSATTSSEETMLHDQVKPSSSKDVPTDFKS